MLSRQVSAKQQISLALLIFLIPLTAFCVGLFIGHAISFKDGYKAGLRHAQEMANSEKPARTRIWEGYYTAGLNYRYALHLSPKHKGQAAIAIEWRKLQSKWRELRESKHMPADVDAQIAALNSIQDDIEEREDPALYDAELMGKLQGQYDTFLGVDRK